MDDLFDSIDSSELAWGQALSGYGPDVREKVRNILAAHNIPLNDPVAAVISSVFATNYELLQGSLELPQQLNSLLGSQGQQQDRTLNELTGLVERSRQHLIEGTKSIFSEGKQELLDAIQQATKVSVSKYEKKIARSFLIRCTVPSVLVLFFVGGLSFFMGTGMKPFFADNSTRRSHEEESLLRWAESDTGRIARELDRMNAGVLQYCLDQQESLKGRCLLKTIDNAPQTQRPLVQSSQK